MAFFDRVHYYPKYLSALSQEAFCPSKTDDFPKSEWTPQNGKVWLVTGSTSGIGFEVACRLAELGADIWLTGRDTNKAQKHVLELKKRAPNCKVDYLLMDFADLTTIKPAVQKLLDSGSELHGIVHNAGVMMTPTSAKTKQGFELQLGTNDLAPWLLQKLLDPLLLKSTTSIKGRVVWVSSIAHTLAPHSGFDIAKDPNVHCISTDEVYGVSKAVDAMMCIQWTKLHPDSNVKSTTVHPGIIASDLTRNLNPLKNWVYHRLTFPVSYGATSELAAAIKDVPNNSYVIPWGRLGKLRGDIKEAAEQSLDLSKWLDSQVSPYL